MHRQEKQRLTGMLYLAGAFVLLLWSINIVFQILLFVLGLMLLNNGLILLGMGSLWQRATRIFMQRHF